MKSLLDPDFKYVPSTHTNIRKTFERVRAEQAEATEAKPITGEYIGAGDFVPGDTVSFIFVRR